MLGQAVHVTILGGTLDECRSIHGLWRRCWGALVNMALLNTGGLQYIPRRRFFRGFLMALESSISVSSPLTVVIPRSGMYSEPSWKASEESDDIEIESFA